MNILLVVLFIIYCAIAYQCYAKAKEKGYSWGVFALLGLIPYFNVLVWMYILFLPTYNTKVLRSDSLW